MKTNRKLAVLTAILGIFLFIVPLEGNAQKDSENKNARAAIEEAYINFGRLMQEGNSKELVDTYYTEDAKFFLPDGGIATGRDEINQFFEGIAGAQLRVDLEIKELETCGNMAYEYGVATISNAQGDQLDQNQYMVIWKKDKGNWKIYRDFVKGTNKG